MERRLFLVKNKPDAATIRALKELLEQAIAGRLSGIAYVALLPDRGYSGDIVGSARKHPIYTRGLVRVLEDQAAELTK